MRGGGAFTDSSVESLSLPETIKDIDDGALENCPSLKHVQISPRNEGFSSFDDMIFSKDYSKLLLVPEGKEGAASLPDQTTLVPAAAFSRCSGLSRLLVGDSATYTSYDGILYSKDLKTLIACPAGIGASIVIPAETETIDKDALSGCKDLASITALGNVQKIDATAFSDETKASAVVALPAGEGYNTRKSTWESAGFTNFVAPAKPGATTNPDTTTEAASLTYTLLDDYTLSASWQGKDDPQANLEIPASAEINGVPYRVSTIAENAFANRGSLTSVKLPTTITTINNGAFAGCANLSTIEFPNTLREIGERAFEATSLKDVWLPTSINSIGSRAFASCSSLERVVALGTPEVASDAIAGCINVSIYVPSGSENSWNPGLPSDNNHLMPYGITLSEEPLSIEAGQEADLLKDGNLQAPDPVETSYSYAASPLSVDAGTVSAKKEGTSDVTAVLSLDGIELTRATRTVEVSPNPDAEGAIVQLNSEVRLPAVYLSEASSNQINVSAPTQVVLGEASGYDVATKPDCATGMAIFKNNSTGQPVQLAKVSCDSVSIDSNIEANPSATTALNQQRLFSLYPQDNEGFAVNFGYGDNVNTVVPKDKNNFLITPNSSVPYIFRLNLTNKPDLADARVKEGVADNGATLKTLATVTCTFEGFVPVGHGDKGANFYLENTSVSPSQVYSLAEVKEHAKDISQKGKDSLYYSMYESFIKDDGKYVCKTTWYDDKGDKSHPYGLRIIGINHDELATKSNDGRTVAGLTFQFIDVLNFEYPMKTASGFGNSGGWGMSELRERMNPGDGSTSGVADDDIVWNMVPSDLQDSIEVVAKRYGGYWDSTADSVWSSEDKLFLASYSELVGVIDESYKNKLWLSQEGDQYAYYVNKVDTYSENEILMKHYQWNDWESAWWLRTVDPDNSTNYLCVGEKGKVNDSHDVSQNWSICPCFCL
ncbi:leucine-rich repeat protein [Gordonibacter sp.]|uniref:leucine-rich repeat protein n=1 Tax=Gordonibacter sp. TaxID=1968902 RepID=UPI0025C6CEBD|nr:leucine-rich repeat protein [Gordonibacter sp.]